MATDDEPREAHPDLAERTSLSLLFPLVLWDQDDPGASVPAPEPEQAANPVPIRRPA